MSLRKALLLAALVVIPSLSGAAEGARVERYSAQVAVDASGRVTDVELLGDVPAPFRGVLRQAAEGVEFEPARRDGEAVPSRTALTLAMRLEPDGTGRYAARLEEITGSTVALDDVRRVPYPRSAARDGYGAVVVALVAVQPDGRVDEAASGIHAIALARKGEAVQDPGNQAAFEKTVLRAIRKWRFAVEEVDGQPLATRVLVPVRFCPQASCAGWPMEAVAPDAAQSRPAPQAAGVELAKPRTPAPKTAQAP